jgi:hypothetical protein
VVGAAGFEPATPSPPDWCANRAALRSASNEADDLRRGAMRRKGGASDGWIVAGPASLLNRAGMAHRGERLCWRQSVWRTARHRLAPGRVQAHRCQSDNGKPCRCGLIAKHHLEREIKGADARATPRAVAAAALSILLAPPGILLARYIESTRAAR